ncbi:hypothetical protein HELRODRAFT_177712 [Helobdella robusta]|uniref:C-type lectin domain-containing protein n=1 Tax=Helobdella robusta TaxID=6412 RepID=T1FC44_HELRO|nr:hypothetical protein HELRODRAFT_177712 [Helobdella robusta]ESN97658.1 hypothetical protein HELRODRAFT_177712 [Helobdella robusta]
MRKIAFNLLVGPCPGNFTSVDGRCIYVITQKASWDDGERTCGKHKANLVLVDSYNFLHELTVFLNTNYKAVCLISGTVKSFWTAGKRNSNTNIFNWKIFRTAKFLDEFQKSKNVQEMNNWMSGEPNNQGGTEDCLQMQDPQGKYQFRDVSCKELNCLICQLDV